MEEQEVDRSDKDQELDVELSFSETESNEEDKAPGTSSKDGLHYNPNFINNVERGLGDTGFRKSQGSSNRNYFTLELDEDFQVYPNQEFINKYQNDKSQWINRFLAREETREMFEVFDAEILTYYDSIKATDDEKRKKEKFRVCLNTMIKFYDEKGGLNWHAQVFATGSSISGLDATGSDVDCCVWIPRGMCDSQFKENSHSALQIIHHMLIMESQREEFPFTIKDMKLRDAQIPILKIFTACGLECDLSVCCEEFLSGVHNSLLIKAFTRFDNRFAPLALFVKQWAAKTKLKQPIQPDGKLNSYAITLLLIHFLQCGVSPPVLPNLRKKCGREFYATSETDFPRVLKACDITIPKINAPKNEMSMTELFIRFCIYYSTFNYTGNYISLRDSKVGPKSDCINIPLKSSDLQGSQRGVRFFIKDPIDQHNPGRTLHDVQGAKEIFYITWSVFKRALNKLENYPFPTVQQILRNDKFPDGNDLMAQEVSNRKKNSSAKRQ